MIKAFNNIGNLKLQINDPYAMNYLLQANEIAIANDLKNENAGTILLMNNQTNEAIDLYTREYILALNNND